MKYVIISIKPKYVEKILNKQKLIEFRKQIWKENVKGFFIYCSAPVKKIVAYVEIEKIDKDTPSNLWKKYNKIGGIEKKEYFKYFKNKNKAYGILMKKIYPLNKPICPYEYLNNFYPPQSFMYVDNKFKVQL
jgi:predicted transcriptional regulator